MPATTNRNTLAGGLIFGAFMFFNAYLVMDFTGRTPGRSGVDPTAVVRPAMLVLTLVLLAAGLAVAATRGAACASPVKGYTLLLWLLAAGGLGMAGLYEWMLTRAAAGNRPGPAPGGAILYVQRICILGGSMAGATALLRVLRSRFAPALTTAISFFLLMCAPLGTFVGLWWILKVGPAESGSAPEPALAAAGASVS